MPGEAQNLSFFYSNSRDILRAMSSLINKESLEHLAKLARIELNPKEEERLLRDLGGILDNFKELEKLDTSKIAPLTGGSELENVFREDEAGGSTNQKSGVDRFPESRDGFLKVPPVFE
jgi:aspartyl-tRNA(Asn)/glutamyl-tRNA(Gln) amidotransferase subunit C